MKKKYSEIINFAFNEHINLAKNTLNFISKEIEKSSDIMAKSIKSGGTIFWCGNGGSAADSQHIAAEFVGRFKNDRLPLSSIALTTDTSILTCIANDYSFQKIFSRQITALGRKGDVLIGISTSGKSENVKQALIQAKKMKIKTIALLGGKGGYCKKYADVAVVIPSFKTARIQEVHILIEHLLCELVEKKLGLN